MRSPPSQKPKTSIPSSSESPSDMGRSRRTIAAGGNKRCWNCRERKTACDRSLPSCTNCQRRGIKCQGYGLKLSWPRRTDKRRSLNGDHSCLPIRSRRLEFVNASNPDVELWKGMRRVVRFTDEQGDDVSRLRRTFRVPRPIHLNFLSLAHIDPLQGTHDRAVACRIISSCCDGMRELYPLLIRMSLGDELPPSIAIRHAIAAVSYKYLGDLQTAMIHHARSVSALQTVINGLRTARGEDACQQKFQAIAASLMLNTFEVSTVGRAVGGPSSKAPGLETSSRAWGIFFSGSKQIARYNHTPHKTYEGDPALVLDWLFYHDTMHKFSLRHWQSDQGRSQASQATQDKVVSKAVFSPLRQIILLVTGCSLELLDLIYQTIDAVLDRSDPNYHSPSHIATLQKLEHRVTNLVQVPRVTSSPSFPPVPGETPLATQTTLERRAELFRLATLLYIYRVAWNFPADHPLVAPIVKDGFRVLKEAIAPPPSPDAPLEPNGERPFPLFVMGLEARREEDRRVVVDAMEAAARARPLGNVAGSVRKMVFAAWVRADLHGETGGCGKGDGREEEDMLVVYNSLISGHRAPPFLA